MRLIRPFLPACVAALAASIVPERLPAADPAHGTSGSAASAELRPANGAAQPAVLNSHWAFQPVAEPALPEVGNQAWPSTAIDRFVLARLEERQLSPSPPADRRVLFRRLSFDLLGLPPDPEEIERFERDADPAAYERLVDRLLASPQYGERWGRYWLDVARYADSKGYVYADREEERYTFSYVYRDYVVRAFNEDLPYDQFLIEQIAADCQPAPTSAERLAALGFLTLGRRFVNNVHDIIDDRLDVIFRGTQGLSIGCARCHDHKYDPIPIEDYYSLYGVLAGTTERTVELAPPGAMTAAEAHFALELAARQKSLEEAFAAGREELSRRLRRQIEMYLTAVLEAPALPGAEFYVILRDPEDLNPVIVHRWKAWLLRIQSSGQIHPVFGPWFRLAELPADQFQGRAGELIEEMTAPDSPRGRINGSIARLLREHPPASMRDVAARYAQALKEVDERWRQLQDEAASRGQTPPAMLADAEEEELRQVLYAADAPTTIPEVGIYQIEPFFDEAARVKLAQQQMKIDQWHLRANVGWPRALVLAEAQPVEPRVFTRGDPRRMGNVVPRRNLLLLAGAGRHRFEEGTGRLELARDIASPRNPLTARVMVNRLWLHHFGAGLVRTPSDFGARAEPPSHPELLDYLAGLLVREHWSLKAVHRQMLLSSTYRQQSADRQEARLRDPENRLLWRMNPRRLDWEAFRDTLLAVAGNLDQRMGGQSVDIHGDATAARRTLYAFIDRQNFPSLFRIFDAANPDQHTPLRHATTVPQQSLYLLNNPFVARQARGLARRARQRPEDPPALLAARMARLAWQRALMPGEIDLLAAFLEEPREPAPALPAAEVAKHPPQRWQAVYGHYDPEAKRWNQVSGMIHFHAAQWQPEGQFPSAGLGLACITRDGGHAGLGPEGCVGRRFKVEISGRASLTGSIKHDSARGDGILAVIVSSRAGELARAIVHKGEASLEVKDHAVAAGEEIDFIVCPMANGDGDEFRWNPQVEIKPHGEADPVKAGAAADFAGPPAEHFGPLDPLEELAQILLLSNELLFVD
jgi:hypothetical protein